MSLTTKVNGNSVPVSAIHLGGGKYLYVTAVTLSQLGFSYKHDKLLCPGEVIARALDERLDSVNLSVYDQLLTSIFTAFTTAEGLVLVTASQGALIIYGSCLLPLGPNVLFLNSDKLPSRNRFIFIVDPDRVEGRREE